MSHTSSRNDVCIHFSAACAASNSPHATAWRFHQQYGQPAFEIRKRWYIKISFIFHTCVHSAEVCLMAACRLNYSICIIWRIKSSFRKRTSFFGYKSSYYINMITCCGWLNGIHLVLMLDELHAVIIQSVAVVLSYYTDPLHTHPLPQSRSKRVERMQISGTRYSIALFKFIHPLRINIKYLIKTKSFILHM